MPKKSTKSNSKRGSLKQKYNIQKKVKEHNRKLRKAARNNPDQVKKHKKDPGIPNLWPYKSQIIQKLVRDKEKAEALAHTNKAKRTQMIEKARLKANGTNLASSSHKTEGGWGMDTKLDREQKVAGRHWYWRELKDLIDQSDIIIEVLDARDPAGCRCPEIERRVLQHGDKRMVLILNKIDLVPAEVAQEWTKVLRREFPTIAFKSATSQGRGRIKQLELSTDKATDGMFNSRAAIGAGALMQLLKNYCRKKNVKSAVTVGVIGYPNVGKSSIINSLKRSKATGVGASAGFTKKLQQVRLDKHIQLIDSPGVLFSDDQEGSAGLVLRNALKLESLEDCTTAVEKVVELLPAEHLCKTYGIGLFDGALDFLQLVGRKRGKLGKGGVPNIQQAGRLVLQDWNSGKIPFYTRPPKNNDVKSSVVVTDWSKEFDVETIEKLDKLMVKQSAKNVFDFTEVQSSGPASLTIVEEEGGMDDDDDEAQVPSFSKGNIAVVNKAKKGPAVDADDSAMDSKLTKNKAIRQAQKKKQKKGQKTVAREMAAEEAAAKENPGETEALYSFDAADWDDDL